MYSFSATFYLLIGVTFNLAGLTQSGKLKICIISNELTSEYMEDYCTSRHNEAFECVRVNDRLECLRLFSRGEADLAVFEPEDLFASLRFHDIQILITHELRRTSNSWEYGMILLVGDGINSKADLYGKKLCHPGYGTIDNNWTPVIANYLQDKIMPLKCEPSLTLLENRFAALSEWFTAACFPGVWTFSTEETMDKQLKSKYSNLCALCDNGTCNIDDKDGGHTSALKCLTENVGDVAWLPLEMASYHFKEAKIDTLKYKLMCPDGTTRNWKYWSKSCSWITRPWPVVAARREAAGRVAKIIKGLRDGLKEIWQFYALQLVLQMDGLITNPIRMDPVLTPEDFLDRFTGLSSAYARSTCYPSRIIKWCVTSNLEERKCQWLRRAALSYGIEPEINCVQQAGRNTSIEYVARGLCDFYIAQPEDLMTAQENNLTIAMELIGSDSKHLNNIVILVKNESHYQKIDDLKGATACFTKYRSVGWNAFVALMSNRTKDPIWSCSDVDAMTAFFTKIFLPEELVEDEEMVKKTFDCLISGNGDVAFVTLKKEYRDHQGIRKICVEDVPNSECVLTWSTLGSVMVHKKLPQVRRREIIQALNQMNTWFGVNHPRYTEALSLSSPFDNHSNVIFPELFVNFLENVSYPQLPRPYTGILEQLSRQKNQATYGAGSMNWPINILIPSICIILIQ